MTTKKKEVVIGIDLGTSYSVGAILESNGKVKALPNLNGELLTASVVNLRDEKNQVVGTAALNQMAFAPEYTIRLVKRSIGKTDSAGRPITVFIHPDSGKTYLPEEISAMIIRHLVESVETGLGATVVGVVITVPAYFDDPPRNATRRAGELAGVPVLSIINEPTAAGLAFGLDHAEDGVFAVFDLGGGTFDISILQIQGKDFRVLATDGDRDLGGSDIDNLILEKVIAAFKAEHGIEITSETDLPAWLETLSKCEIAKKALSQSETASFMVSSQGQRLVFELTRSDFNALIASIVVKTRTITERALAAAHLKPKDINDVLLAGGSTRIIAVREMLKDLFGKAPRSDTQPDEAVAMGAAIFAARKAADENRMTVDSEGKKVLPPPVKMVDVNSHPLGCLALDNGVERNCVIIPANTPLPAEKEEKFSLVHANQSEARIAVAQGADKALPADCTILGELILGGLPPGPMTDRVTVKYGLTTEGTLTITGTDTVSKKTTSDVKRDLIDLIKRINHS